jgi:flavodoxin
MRIHIAIVVTLLLAIGLLVAGGCAKQNQTSGPKPVATEKPAQQTAGQNKKILIAYFSHSGNTKAFAEAIQKQVGGSLWAIEPQVVYPKVYNEVVEQAKGEVDSKHTPALTAKISNIRDYDIIFIGTPIWWYTIAPPVRTFLSEHDMTDKIIVPFCTHKGSGLSGIDKTIQELQPKAKVMEGLAIWDNQANSKQADIQNWLRRLNL